MALPGNFHDVYGNNWWHASYITFQRPAFYLAFHFPATVSFQMFRTVYLLLAAALPLLGYGLMRAHGTSRMAAGLAGAVLATHPFFVKWGMIVGMDSLMACLLLAALWARRQGQWEWSALLFLGAIWTKETAVFAAAGLLAWSWGRRWVRGEAPLWPMQLDRAQSGLVVAIAAGLLPITVAMSKGLRAPGGVAHGSAASILELVTLSSWLLVPLVAGLAFRSSRVLCGWALAAVSFFFALHSVAGRAVEAWYAVPSAALCVIAAAAALDSAWRQLGGRRRWGSAGATMAVVLLAVIMIVVPASAAKERAVHPLTGDSAPSLVEMHHYETLVRDQDLLRTAHFLANQNPTRLFLFDVQYSFAYYPFVDQYREVLAGTSIFFQLWPQPLEPLAQAVETNGTLLFVEDQDALLNEALRVAYSECQVFGEGRYHVYEGWRCPGGLERLRALVEYPSA
ncbi:MAG: hypothetical protein WC876_07815 [Candidatus Thermoplasmatota archaeon]